MQEVKRHGPWIQSLAVAALILPTLCGCHRAFSEALVRTGMSGPDAPQWVQGSPQLEGRSDEVFFVGRGTGYNVLDERAAVASAHEDVYRQVAELIATRVLGSSHEIDARANGETHFLRHGANGITALDDHSLVRTLPGAELRQAIVREATMFTHSVTGDLVDRDVHFEKWAVVDEPVGAFGRASRGMYRYKCWVLMSIPRAKLEQRIDEFNQLATDAYERWVSEYERARRWEEDERNREIAEADKEREHERKLELERLRLRARLAQLQLDWLKEARQLALEDRELRIQREEDARHWARQDQVEDRTEAREIRRIMAIDRAHYAIKNH